MASRLKNDSLIIDDTQENTTVITGIETTVSYSEDKIPTSKAVYSLFTSLSDSGFLVIAGNWANPQYTSSLVDYAGLIFLATLPNGNVINATVSSVSPNTWSSTVGTQTATFTCTAGGFSFTATKSASVKVKGDPVGGTIFYINTSSTNTYTFYNASGTQVSEPPTVGTDCTGWTYTKNGNSVDKFYVYEINTGLVTSKYWGYYNITTSATGNSIGAGKTNTSKVLAITDTSSYASGSIWEYIRNMRINKTNGCDDWFVGCDVEYNQLRSSGTTGAYWVNTNSIWSSHENNSSRAWGWDYTNSLWGSSSKDYRRQLVPIRAF